MSRALTVFSRREHQNQYKDGEVERIMAEQGCSEPVAKNLLKYAKLGVGPLAASTPKDDYDRPRDAPRSSSGGYDAGQFPPRLDRKAAAALAEQKLRERQEQEELAEAKRYIKPRKAIGISSLGAVMKREDEVDPFKQAPARPAGKKEAEDEEEGGMSIFEARPTNARPMGKKTMSIGGISSLAMGKITMPEPDPLEAEFASGSKAEDDDEEDDTQKFKLTQQEREFIEKRRARQAAQAEDKRKPGKKQKRRRESSEESADEEPQAARDYKRDAGHERGGSAQNASSASDSLMSEKQVMAMMGKQRKVEGTSARGSVRAKTRILKEREEWEKAKANNPEFWKAPQFALCYSAETGKKARGAG